MRLSAENLRIPPPLAFLAALLVGLGLQWLLREPPAFANMASRVLGGAVVLVGVAIVVPQARAFRRLKTTINPFGTPSSLRVSGAYRFSRNPIYLGLMTAYLGAALLAGSLWVLVAGIAPVAFLARVVVPHEEASLRAQFGENYEDYCRRVRRWI